MTGERTGPTQAWTRAQLMAGPDGARRLLRNDGGDAVCPVCFLLFESKRAGMIHVINKHPGPEDVSVEGGIGPGRNDVLDAEYRAPRVGDGIPAPGGTPAHPTIGDPAEGQALFASIKAPAL